MRGCVGFARSLCVLRLARLGKGGEEARCVDVIRTAAVYFLVELHRQ